MTALLGLPSEVSAANERGCRPQGSRTVAATRSVRVYKTGKWSLFACAYRTGRPIDIGIPADHSCDSPASCGDGTAVLSVAGRYVLMEDRTVSVRRYPNEPGRTIVNLLDTVTGGQAFLYSSIRDADAPDHDDGDVARGAVTASGRFALIVRFDIAGRGPEYRVRTGKLRGSTLVDSGEGIDATSLAVAGRTAYWKHDGQARSVELPE